MEASQLAALPMASASGPASSSCHGFAMMDLLVKEILPSQVGFGQLLSHSNKNLIRIEKQGIF